MPLPTPRFAPLILAWILSSSAAAAGQADPLLKITPPQSAATLVVEGLSDQVREILASPLYDRLPNSAVVQQWAASPWIGEIRESARQVEAAFGVPIPAIRDQILGQAAVLAFFPGPLAAPQESRGLLMTRGHDRDLVERLFGAINAAQARSGEVLRIERGLRGSISYAIRVYRPGTKPNEFYAHLDGDTFAWSNSESILQAVIDLKFAGGRSLADDPSFDKVRRGLSGRSGIGLFLGPEMIRRALAGARPSTDLRERVIGLLVRHYAGAIGFVGVGLGWKDGVEVHSHESLVVDRLDATARNWLAGPSAPSVLSASIPDSAMAVAALNVDFQAVRQVALKGLDPDDLSRLETHREAWKGLMSWTDPINDVLPRLDPGMLAYLDARARPDRRPFLPLVGVIGWSDPAGRTPLATPIDHALKTSLSFRALKAAESANPEILRVQPLVIEETSLTVLTNGHRNLAAYRIDGGRLIFGNSAESVKRFGPTAIPSVLQEVRARHCSNLGTFAIVDLDRLVRELTKARIPIAQRLAANANRPYGDVDRDLGQVLSLLGSFRASAFTSEVSAGGSEIHRKVLMIAR